MLGRGELPGCELPEGSGGYRLGVALLWSVGKRKAAKKRPKVLWLRTGINGPQSPGNRDSGGGKEAMSSIGGLLDLRAAWGLQMEVLSCYLHQETWHPCWGDWPSYIPVGFWPPPLSLFPVLRLHWGACHGDLCSFPPPELCLEAGCAADYDRHLRSADRDHLCGPLSALRQPEPQWRVSPHHHTLEKGSTPSWKWSLGEDDWSGITKTWGPLDIDFCFSTQELSGLQV